MFLHPLIWSHCPHSRLFFLKLANMWNQEISPYSHGEITTKKRQLLRQNSRAKERRNPPRGSKDLLRHQPPRDDSGCSSFPWMECWPLPCHVSPSKEQSLSSYRASWDGIRYTTSSSSEETCHLGQWSCVPGSSCTHRPGEVAKMQGEYKPESDIWQNVDHLKWTRNLHRKGV